MNDMELREKELEDFLSEPGNFRNAIIDLFPNCYVTNVARQVSMGNEFGRCDLIGDITYQGNPYKVIIELKAEPMEVKDLNQLCRYLTYAKLNYPCQSFGMLLGPSFKNCFDMVWILENLPNVKTKYYKAGLERGLEIFNTDSVSDSLDLCQKHGRL